MSEHLNALRNGVVLTELGGLGDGPYCAVHGKGSALVMLGTYIVDPGDSVPYDSAFLFKPDRHCYEDYLYQHIAAARKSGASVGVSVVSVDLDHTIEFLRAAEEAGADYVSLCLYSELEMFVSVGLSSALLLRKNWPRLRHDLAVCLGAFSKPFIAKIGVAPMSEGELAVSEMVAAGVSLVHANLGKAATPEGQALIRRLKGAGAILIAGGGIATVEEAKAILEAGAEAVAIGTAAMEDPDFCGNLQAALRLTQQGKSEIS